MAKGFILMEILIGVCLLALAGLGIFTVLGQGMLAIEKIERKDEIFRPVQRFYYRMEKDLRSTVRLKSYPFRGSGDEISFPALLPSGTAASGPEKELYLVRYGFKEGKLMREQTRIKDSLHRQTVQERSLLEGVRHFEFLFAYREDDEKSLFEPFWTDDPYPGIPRGIMIRFEIEDAGNPVQFQKLVLIPDGVMGSLTLAEAKAA